MKTVSLNDKPAINEIIRDTPPEEVLVTRDGHAVALVIPFDDEDANWYSREADPAFIESIRRARCQLEGGQVVTHADLSKELGM